MYLNKAGLNVACWGTNGTYLKRGKKVIELLGIENLHCFGLTKNGQPKHSLYLKCDIEPEPMELHISLADLAE